MSARPTVVPVHKRPTSCAVCGTGVPKREGATRPDCWHDVTNAEAEWRATPSGVYDPGMTDWTQPIGAHDDPHDDDGNRLCHVHFEEAVGYEPFMGDEHATFAPGACAHNGCNFEGVTFRESM